MAAALEAEFGHPIIIMPSIQPDAGRHIVLPTITAYFWRGGNVGALLRAIWQRLRNSALLISWIIGARPVLCICIEPDSWLVAVIARGLYGTRVAVDLQEYYPDRGSAFPAGFRGGARRAIRGGMKLLARHTDLFIHVSQERDAAYQWLQADDNKKTFFMLYPDKIPAEARRPDSDDRILLAHAGTVRPSYAGFELLEAFASALDQVPKCTLRVLGGFAAMEKIGPQLKEWEKRGALATTNWMNPSQVGAELATCDIGLSLVLPLDLTHIYAQPRKLYEYMAAGLPVIGSDVPTVRRVIEEHQCGILVDARDPRAIADAIVKLARDPELRRTLGENGRRAIREHFHAEAERTRLTEALRPLLNGHRA